VDTTLTRFVAANEGRNDEIAGYLDGFALWRDLARAGVQGVIRGDEAMGGRWVPRKATSARLGLVAPRRRTTPTTTSFEAPSRGSALARPVDLGAPGACPRLRRPCRPDCLRPITLAGLNGAKARYLEIANPLLSRRIVDSVHSLPRRLRDRAQAFSRIADSIDRAIPYARFSSTPSTQDFLASCRFLETLVGELTAPDVERVLPGDGALQCSQLSRCPVPAPAHHVSA